MPTADGDRFLRQLQFVGEPTIGLRFFDRIQIFALDVFDQRDLEQIVVGDVANDDRHFEQAGALCGAPAAFAGDDLVAVVDASHENRLNDAMAADRLRELFEPRLVDLLRAAGADWASADRCRFRLGRGRGSTGSAGGRRGARGISALKPRPSAGRFSTMVISGIAQLSAPAAVGASRRRIRGRTRRRLRRRAIARHRGSRARRGSALRRAGCCAE